MNKDFWIVYEQLAQIRHIEILELDTNISMDAIAASDFLYNYFIASKLQ